MTKTIFAVFDAQGYSEGFYTPDIHGGSIPKNAVQITEQQWQELLQYSNTRKWVDGKIEEAQPRALEAPSQEQIDEMDALDEEHQRLRLAMSSILLEWSKIETQLAYLLVHIIGNKNGIDQMIALSIFFSPTGLEPRIKIVEDSFKALTNLASDPASQNAAWKRWEALRGALKKSKDMRNTVAHGTISAMWVNPESAPAKNHVRLTSNTFDFTRMDFEKMAKGAVLGFSASDLEHALKQQVPPIFKLIEELKNTILALRAGTFKG
ncbi:hypothetical protein M8994_07110 [Brucella sp. 21LCYQ03]|nr:hypothetical protein [Brucella sp. 21LCYQ03]